MLCVVMIHLRTLQYLTAGERFLGWLQKLPPPMMCWCFARHVSFALLAEVEGMAVALKGILTMFAVSGLLLLSVCDGLVADFGLAVRHSAV